MAKNGHVYEGGKVGRSDATPTKFVSVNSYDLKLLSFKFGNDTFITFEMPRVSYRRPPLKMNISLLFRPSVIRGPWIRVVFRVLWIHNFEKNEERTRSCIGCYKETSRNCSHGKQRLSCLECVLFHVKASQHSSIVHKVSFSKF